MLSFAVLIFEDLPLSFQWFEGIPLATAPVVIRSERRKILKRRELSVKMKIRKGEICRYTSALGLEVLDRRYVFAPEAAMRQAMDWYKERI